ncbi:DUF1310 domain-containing protein [Streptococcus iniae]|uniref:DUF1310 domain-containing protein n=2 Tax=Streptococcus iniae TaxID=1346 RepID=UPI00217EC7CB|nr:DUF1310 domain-containing protein [Streptococcus iniae]
MATAKYHREVNHEEKMIAIAHSEEAKKIYLKHLLQQDKTALSDKGIIKSYEIDNDSLDYNPMGGLMVTLIINNDKNLTIDFDLIDNGDGTYHSAYFVISPALAEKLGY